MTDEDRSLQIREDLPEPIRTYVPEITEKMLVDFANGIQSASFKIQFQQNNNSLLNRTWGAITGENADRQHAINQHFAGSLEASLSWLTDLTEHVARTDFAVSALGDAIKDTAGKLEETRDVVVDLDKARQIAEYRLGNLEKAVQHQDFKSQAEEEMELFFDQWEAGNLAHLSPLARPYLVFERLFWGKFGQYCHYHPDQADSMRARAQEKARKACRLDWQIGTHENEPILPTSAWSSLPQGGDTLMIGEAIAYLGDWADMENQPLAWAASQSELQQEEHPRNLPYLLKPSQVADRLADEVLGRHRFSSQRLLGVQK